ncbi:MAG: preprotein translocase subunit SecG [Armatimonadetes bacterium]|nr:preprotein translocase subunit SecG [Armatimonadota bacterium]
MAIVVEWVHVISCIGLVAVIMFQVTKSEGGGGGLGWGTIGGKATSSLNIPVGVERILQPLTFWCAVTFLVSATLNSVDEKKLGTVLTVVGPLYIIAMVWGRQLGAWIKKHFGAE